MVLTDLPFDRNSRPRNRYDLIRPEKRAGSAPPSREQDEDNAKSSEEYARFLKSQERLVGPEGFLDSSRYSHSFNVRTARKSMSPRRAKAASSSASNGGSPRNSVVSLSARIEKDQYQHDKRMKVIEDYMWQHKQEGRHLKRVEGDVINNQRALQQMLKDYEKVVNRKRLREEKKLNKGLEKYTVLQREHTHMKTDILKQRIQHHISSEQSFKDQDRKVELRKLDISRKYKAKQSEIEVKRIERLRTNQEFETKVRAQEEEEFRLQQELAELAIALNMEAQKGEKQSTDRSSEKKKEKTQIIKEDLAADKGVDTKLAKGDGEIKDAELTKRKLSMDLTLTKAHLSIKKRDEQRHLTDTQIRLHDNATMQRQLNDSARFADMELQAKRIDQRLQAHNERRETQLSTRILQKKDKEEAQQAILQDKFRKRYNEQRRKEHQDTLKFFQKMVTKGEDAEQNLYNKVRNAEYARQQQEQTVKRLQQNLHELKRVNAIKIKEDLAESFHREKELEEKLLREKAELDKSHSQREESYDKLQKHRALLKEDKYQLKEQQREHERLLKIGMKSDLHSDSFIYA